MAEDDRTIAEGSASRSLQGGMGLHLRGCCLQSGSLAESSDSSVVGQDRSVFVYSKNDLRAPADAAKDSSLSHRIETQGESESRRMFFRSLLDRCDVRHRRISKTALMLAIEGSRSASKKQEHR